MAQEADFLACLCNNVMPSSYLLTVSCYPTHLKDQVDEHISSKYFVNFQGNGSSEEPLCHNDKTFVSFSEAFSLKQSEKTKDLCLR